MYPISIILPVYNGIKYLEQSVVSVLNQQYDNFEFLIVDDCSDDGSWEYLQSLTDKRVKIFQNPANAGLFFNLNFLIKQSTGELIKLWSQDDVMELNCIKEVISFHQRYPQIGFSYTDRSFIDAGNEYLDIGKTDETPELISPGLHARIAFITGSIAGNIANVTINKAVLEQVGLFNEQMKISGDFEMWVRLAKDHPVGFVKQPLIRLRIHKEQLSGQEKYFIYHLKEDIQAYRILFSYVSPEQQAEGRKLLRNKKLVFYYTLMLKALLKGKVKTAYKFLKLLNSFDNLFVITGGFLKNKIFSNH
jgi:glycosyltransferase involved in cell wall biosynthesis